MSAEQVIAVQEERENARRGQEAEVVAKGAATEEPIQTGEVPSHQSQLFMVRMWPEPLDGGQVEWRGRVDHVASGEGYPFRDWARLIVCLEKMLKGGFRTGLGFG